VTKSLFRGNPRLLIAAAPWVLVVLAFKLVVELTDTHLFQLSPLLAGAIGAEVFILGFLLNGTASDFKEAEKLPGEVASSLETIADECMITHEEFKLPEARTALRQLIEISRSVRQWLIHDRGLDDVLADIRALNGPYRVFAPVIQAGFTTRLKSEQAAVRKLVLRMDTMRRTSYVAAGYLIAEVTAVLLMFVLVVTELGEKGHAFTEVVTQLVLVGLISYLLIYLVSLIRDLDNPFEYKDGKPGAADVSLEVLERNEDRLRAMLAAVESSAPAPEPASPVTTAPAPAAVDAATLQEAAEPQV
jgi:predicted membrane chloride channel (bestrophin family)